MERCFVIQPFDGASFDKRFDETFKPAIDKAGLEPYRTDRDLSVRIPIEDIEKGIRESVICLAEITLNNPNVWHELGYAFACGKDVIMVCSDERTGNYPFDISHRTILKYTTKSKGGFEELEDKITKTINAVLAKNKTIDTIQHAPIVPTEGLDINEIACLLLAMDAQPVPGSSSSIDELKKEMTKAGYTGAAASLAIRVLTLKGFLETFTEEVHNDYNEIYTYSACRITDIGVSWVIENKSHVQMKRPGKSVTQNDNSTDGLPF
jgi:hypothetical protein